MSAKSCTFPGRRSGIVSDCRVDMSGFPLIGAAGARGSGWCDEPLRPSSHPSPAPSQFGILSLRRRRGRSSCLFTLGDLMPFWAAGTRLATLLGHWLLRLLLLARCL